MKSQKELIQEMRKEARELLESGIIRSKKNREQLERLAK